MSTDELFFTEIAFQKIVCSKLLTKVDITNYSDIKWKLLKPPYEKE